MEINKAVIASDLGDEVVLLDTAREHYYSLSGVGRRFWQLVSKDTNVDAVIATLLSEFDTSEAQLRADLATLLAELLEHKLMGAALP
ncbi:PqqD family protein [Gymnodinialimonas sp.]